MAAKHPPTSIFHGHGCGLPGTSSSLVVGQSPVVWLPCHKALFLLKEALKPTEAPLWLVCRRSGFRLHFLEERMRVLQGWRLQGAPSSHDTLGRLRSYWRRWRRRRTGRRVRPRTRFGNMQQPCILIRAMMQGPVLEQFGQPASRVVA